MSRHTEEDKAEALLLQFMSVFKISISVVDKHPHVTPSEKASIPAVPIKIILKKMSSLSSRKAPGIDGIIAPVVRNCALILAPCLTEIANRCLHEMFS